MNNINQLLMAIAVFGLSLIALVFVYAVILANRRKRYISKLFDEYSSVKKDMRCFSVRYYSEKKLKKVFKIYPWEGYGVLCMEDDNILYHGIKGKKELKISYPISKTKVDWVGKINVNGPLFWFSVSDSVRTSFFTSETGASFLNSEKLTRKIYAQIKKQSRMGSHLELEGKTGGENGVTP
jgi:hypothetical protein